MRQTIPTMFQNSYIKDHELRVIFLKFAVFAVLEFS
jgi:hypothetical protein